MSPCEELKHSGTAGKMLRPLPKIFSGPYYDLATPLQAKYANVGILLIRQSNYLACIRLYVALLNQREKERRKEGEKDIGICSVFTEALLTIGKCSGNCVYCY